MKRIPCIILILLLCGCTAQESVVKPVDVTVVKTEEVTVVPASIYVKTDPEDLDLPPVEDSVSADEDKYYVFYTEGSSITDAGRITAFTECEHDFATPENIKEDGELMNAAQGCKTVQTAFDERLEISQGKVYIYNSVLEKTYSTDEIDHLKSIYIYINIFGEDNTYLLAEDGKAYFYMSGFDSKQYRGSIAPINSDSTIVSFTAIEAGTGYEIYAVDNNGNSKKIISGVIPAQEIS